jgi:hypothetical protein
MICAIFSCTHIDTKTRVITDSAITHSDSSLTEEQINDRIISGRASEAVIWGLPAVNFAAMLEAMKRDVKGENNQIVFWSKPLNWRNQTLTPNTEALYFMPFFNTEKTGPIVIEIPAADDGSITGTIMDCWQTAQEDVGPAGVDKGKGGKYLILPPAYKKKYLQGILSYPVKPSRDMHCCVQSLKV